VEEPDHVGSARLLVEQEERLLPRLLVQLWQTERARRERERVQVVEHRLLALQRERTGVLCIEHLQLRLQRGASARQQDGEHEHERKRDRDRQQQRQLYSEPQGPLLANVARAPRPPVYLSACSGGSWWSGSFSSCKPADASGATPLRAHPRPPPAPKPPRPMPAPRPAARDWATRAARVRFLDARRHRRSSRYLRRRPYAGGRPGGAVGRRRADQAPRPQRGEIDRRRAGLAPRARSRPGRVAGRAREGGGLPPGRER